ncbi:MAG: bifunctional heptose 7-phosphate kinase/heptose 1-phosphate adenyltransferase, partial [Candidatus Binatia bacterium]
MARIVRRFPRVRLLVVGDLMLDQFVWGRVSRISPEAPVPVVQVTRESFHLGGAANVAANIRALGGRATIAGVVGQDDFGRRVLEELRKIGVDVSGVVRSRSYSTIRKIRILAHQQQVVRLDREQPLASASLPRAIRDRVAKSLASVDGVVVSDYGKGVVTRELLSLLAGRRDGRLHLFIDPKKGNFAHYRRATLIKPNLEAASLAAGIEIRDEGSLRRAGEHLVRSWESDAVLI